ncbi:cytochrome P450 [Coniophora puteana RWD-64-598 SS2]|uniref:Cytochrome P450 n=1 Tax=Coniophora puteana (strain RWD-64-598) TaxID=741705 RepID=A0A5M3MZ81_CONPW|nr:cytochrome P450 [Coniophora puteana RWD-64-598 SS2]EIW84452.1 cytochrome P450 [Coniophora puteana RWD-64-598 SS2]
MPLISSLLREPTVTTAAIAAFVTFALLLLRRARASTTSGGSLRQCTLPGPKPWPLVGNVRGMDVSAPWKSYKRWSETYGPIFRTRLVGFDIVVISDERIARELLDRRSGKYSSRMWFPTAEPYGFGRYTTLLEYTDTWRHHRRVMHQHLRIDAVRNYRPMQLRKVRQLLENMLASPDDYREHFQTFAASIIMAAVYGYQARAVKDPLVEKVNHSLEVTVRVSSPELAILIGVFPFIKYIPTWFLGGSLNAASCRRGNDEHVSEPFKYLEETIEPDSSIPSMAYEGLRNAKKAQDSNTQIALLQNICGTAFGAGAETTASSLIDFVLAMVLYPDVQERAYAEITRVCGTDRLPTFEDRPELPFIDAVVRETQRWAPVVPMGIPHLTTEDDIYEGEFIPKGTAVVVNIWAICNDPARFPAPSDFRPERFLSHDGSSLADDPDLNVDLVFGFGRRICPGKHLAEASLWPAFAAMLAVFRFEKAGAFEPEWSSGSTSCPRPFPCRIVPRDPRMDASRLAEM